MKKLIVLALVAFFTVKCTEAPKNEENSPKLKSEAPAQKVDYSIELVTHFQTEMNIIDSLKPEIVDFLPDDQMWIAELTPVEREQYKEEIRAVKLNLVIERYYTYKTLMLNECDVFMKEAKDSILKLVSAGLSTYEKSQEFEKKYIAEHDTAFVCSGTEKKITAIKEELVARLKK